MILALCLLTLAKDSAADVPRVNDLKATEQEPDSDSNVRLDLRFGAPLLPSDPALAQNLFFNQKAPNADLKFKLFPISPAKGGGFFVSGGLGYNITELGIGPPDPRNTWKYIYGTNDQNLFVDLSVGYEFSILENITGKAEVSDTFIPLLHENSPTFSVGLNLHF